MVDTATKPADSRPDTQGGVLVLRCCGPSRVGQIVRLKSDKCTIGSNPGCTLRLRARGVKPLHCLILRGRAETVIRRWAADTRLNGQTFSDAPLLVGDRLGIGPIEFEVLDPSVRPPTEGASPDDLRREEVRQPRDGDRLAARLRLSNRQGRRRVRRLIEHLRRARKELAQLQGSGAGGTQHAESAQLEQKRRTLEEVERRWETARAEAETQLKERAGQLDDQMAELEAQRAQLHRQQSEWEASRAEAEMQLAARAEQLDTREAELDARLTEAARPRPQAEDDSVETRQPASASFSPAPGEEEPSREAPANSEEIFRRLGMGMPVPVIGKPLAEGKSELAAAPLPDSPPASQVFGGRMARKWPAMPDSVDDNDESVDLYMARLLERVRGAAGDKPSGNPAKSPATKTGSIESAGSVSANETAGTFEESSPPSPSNEEEEEEEEEGGKSAEQEPAEMSPRTAAPERQENLSAMREVANASAQTAIHRHMRGRLLSAGYTKLAGMSLGLFGGTASIWIWATDAHSPMALAFAVAGFAVAAFFGIWYALLVGQLLFGPSDYPLDGARKEAKPTGTPIDDAAEVLEGDPPAEPEKTGPSATEVFPSGAVNSLLDGIPMPVTEGEIC